MKLKVFVSHKKEDSRSATAVALRLNQNGLDVYLDVIDNVLEKTAEDLADYIQIQMSDCDQLMAVVSYSTTESWWVPWEIGVATEKNFLISTYAIDNTLLPGYLKKWPYLKNMTDIDTYARQVLQAREKSRQQEIRKGYGVNLTQSERATIAKGFHRDLKQALGQYTLY